MSIIACQLDRVRGPIVIGSDGEILPDSIPNLKSAVRTTVPHKSSNSSRKVERLRKSQRDARLLRVAPSRRS